MQSATTRLLRSGMLGLLLLACSGVENQLPVLYTVPDAALVADSGEALRLSELRGSVAIYNFIFTECAGSCPIMTRQMQGVVVRFPEGEPIRFVSVSVDPANDTPETLQAYARKVRNDDRWIFLTGTRDEVINLSVDGFKLAAGDQGSSPAEPILHSSKFILVDGDGQVRGYYDSNSQQSLDELVDHAGALIRGLS